MAGKGDIGKIALDALIRPATIPLVTPEVGTKISRGIFKNMLKRIGSDRNYNFMQNAGSMTDKYGEQTEKRFSAIENILKKRNSDPDQFISEAVSTGRINGMKLSSKERNELAEKLALVKMYKQGPEFTSYRYGNTEPSDLQFEGRYTDDIYKGMQAEFPSETALERLNRAFYPKIFKTSQNDRDILDKMTERLSQQYRLENQPTLPLTLDSSDAIAKAIGLKSTYGRGVKNYRNNYFINEPINQKIIVNQLISRYNITDPKQAESLAALKPEWQGTDEDLVALVRMLNP